MIAHHCSTCNITFAHSQSLSNHIKSKKHTLNSLELYFQKQHLQNDTCIEIKSNKELIEVDNYVRANRQCLDDSLTDSDSEDNTIEDLMPADLFDISIHNELDGNNCNNHQIFPNLVYKDFMNIVDKYNLSDTTGNAIIKFFKEHSFREDNLLPSSTKVGREYMKSMNADECHFIKRLILSYNNRNYYLYYRSIISVIEELLRKQELTQDFLYHYEEYYVINSISIYLFICLFIHL
jgi:hypothetical protein